MKAKYLIQIETKNAYMGATGWFTVHGAQTKPAADALAADFRHARAVTDSRYVRVISAVKFTNENRAANHATMRAKTVAYVMPMRTKTDDLPSAPNMTY